MKSLTETACEVNSAPALCVFTEPPELRTSEAYLAAPPWAGRETIPISDNSPRKGGYPEARGQGYGRHECANDCRQLSGLSQSFAQLIPTRPYCADNLADGLQIRKKAVALKKRHLQLNGPASFTWMIQDIDRPGAYLAHDDANLPPPNVIMVNRANGHAHSAYLMASPVARHNCARVEPLRFFATVERGVARRLEADRSYVGLIAKNPVHTDWMVEWLRDEPYTLHELEGHLFERDMRPDPTPETTWGAGRNVTVFDELRTIAYREVRAFKRDGASFDAWLDRCVKIALALNMQFPHAMKISEVRAIAKSVAKWIWKRFSIESFVSRQSHLGKIANAKRWAGHTAVETTKPWKAEGISRATWYRRKRAQDEKVGGVS